MRVIVTWLTSEAFDHYLLAVLFFGQAFLVLKSSKGKNHRLITATRIAAVVFATVMLATAPRSVRLGPFGMPMLYLTVVVGVAATALFVLSQRAKTLS